MAAGEEQPQLVVAHHRIGGVLADGQHHLIEQARIGLLGRAPGLAPQHVERPVARNGGEPGGRVVRRAVTGPPLQCFHHRVLHGVFSEGDVAGEPHEGGQHAATLVSDHLLQRVDHVGGFTGLG